MILAVDPGLDDTGLAGFDVRHWRPREDFLTTLKRLVVTDVVRTRPDMALADRLAAIYQRLTILIAHLRPRVVYVELPRTAGSYRGPVQKRHFAIGSLLAAAGGSGAPVVLIPASPIANARRRARVRNALKQIRHPLGADPRPSPDLLDAVFLGATRIGYRAHGSAPPELAGTVAGFAQFGA